MMVTVEGMELVRVLYYYYLDPGVGKVVVGALWLDRTTSQSVIFRCALGLPERHIFESVRTPQLEILISQYISLPL